MSLLPAPGEPDAFYLLDLSGWARACFAMAPAAFSPAGERTEVVSGVIGKLVALLRDQDPAFLAAAIDVPGASWRRAIWPKYKEDRPDPGPVYHAQVARILEILYLHRIPVFEGEGFEADDLIAAAAKRARAAGLRTVIVSKDQDLWQLLTEDGSVIAWDGKSPQAIGPAEVRAAYYGIGPGQLGDFLALAGDKGEAPGVPQVGDKTAAKLLLKHGPLEEVLRKWQWEKGVVGANLRDHAGDARLGRQLVTLREDAPVSCSLQDLRVGGYDVGGIRRVYEELGFTRLAREVLGTASTPKLPVNAGAARGWAMAGQAPTTITEEACA